MSRPRLVAIGGASGAGKSTLARSLAPELGAELLRTDALRKALAGVPETARLGREHYTPEASARVYGDLLARAETVLRAGHGVVLDAVFLRPSERQAVAGLAVRLGAGFVGLWLDAPRDVAVARIEGRTGDASDATPAVLDAQLARDAGRIDWVRIAAEGGPEAVLAAARAALGRSP